MSEIFTTYNIIIGGLILTLVVCSYVISNLLTKVETYEEAVESHQLASDKVFNAYLKIIDARKLLDDLDEKGTFKSDDEIGTYFNHLQQAQSELDSLFTQTDAKKESK